MHNVSQEQAAENMPLANTETTRFWRDGRFAGMECLSATFLTHQYAPHSHETFSIGAIEAGCQVNRIRGCQQYSQPGDLYLINPGVVHEGAPAEGGYRYRMIYPGEDLYRSIMEDVTGRPIKGTPAFMQQTVNDEGLVQAFYQAHKVLENGGAMEGEESMFIVLAKIFRRHGDAVLHIDVGEERNTIRKARDYLTDNYAMDVGLEELAMIAGLSRAHFIRAFRKAFHITPHAYLTDVRIRRARRLLRLGGNPSSVAIECGFADQAHFTRHFKARIGVTPGQFRAA